MTTGEFKSWQSVQDEVLRRINSRQWKPGEIIPSEETLSQEFGCARATVNRALRNLAQSGLLDRKRKAGTRVALHPVRKATLDIPVIRREIESRSQSYSYQLVMRQMLVPPDDIRELMGTAGERPLLHVKALHKADQHPYVFENRWINPDVVPAALDVDFSKGSPNEWLVENIPFEGGDIAFSARNAASEEADMLACTEGEGLFIIERSTWSSDRTITYVCLSFAPGYRMQTEL